MGHARLSWLFAPVHAAAVATVAKSFRDNPIIGNPALNRAGLHVARLRAARAVTEWRRRRLERTLDPQDVAAFRRDGFVVRHNYLPADRFKALKDETLSLAAPAREMLEGDAVTRRIALDARSLAEAPALRAFVANPEWLGLLHFAGASALTPVSYIQTIFSHVRDSARDPQTQLHSDTFHPTVKTWFFLTDVGEDEGPFVYVPGSHLLTAGRLDWEQRTSLVARDSPDNETQEGSFRIPASELAPLGLPPPRLFAVPANTLVVADTMGFHARGPSTHPSVRIEVWASGRRNPFLPWLGWDPVAMPIVKGRAISLAWGVSDVAERLHLGRNPWRAAGKLTAAAPVDLRLFE